MQFRGAECPDGLGVSGRDVADVRDESVPGVQRVESAHDPVTNDLGDDRRGRDGGTARVAVDDGAVRWSGRAEPKAVDEAGVGGGMEVAENRAQTRKVAAMEPRAVDLERRDHADADPRRARHHGLEENLALRWRHLLGVVQRRQWTNTRAAQRLVVEEDSGDDEWAGERSPSGLVRSGDESNTEPPIEREETLAGGSSHAAEDSSYPCRSSRTRAFFPTLLRK
jgi:hypothetical protein